MASWHAFGILRFFYSCKISSAEEASLLGITQTPERWPVKAHRVRNRCRSLLPRAMENLHFL